MTTFTPIPDELLALATPAERKAYALALQKHTAKLTPLDYALAVKEKAQRYRHSVFVSSIIAEMEPNDKTIILMPPRVGKSYLISESVPGWVHANDPDAHIIHATYAYDFTVRKFGRPNRLIMQQAHTLGIAPPLDPSARASDFYAINPKYGEGDYTATGVGGQITGLPANWLLLDDLIKNREEAQSQLVRDKTWEWLMEDALSRLEPGARAIMLGTPRHEDDVLARAAESGEWRIVRLPALAEEDDPLGRAEGEALCPERYDEEAYEIIRNRSPQVFAALYQCRPRPKDGDYFKSSNFRYVKADQLPKTGKRFATVDLAHSLKTRADYSVIMCFLATKPPHPKLYVTHVFRDKIESGEHIDWFDRCMESIPPAERPRYAGIEDKTFGSSMLSAARRLGRAGKVLFTPLKADKDKGTRAETAATLMTQGTIVFIEDAPWLEELEHELLAFDNGKHDDQVDTLSYGAPEFAGSAQHVAGPPPDEPQTVEEKVKAMLKHRWREKRADRSLELLT
jgi:predicted phage terminase large subunit-like protein